MEKDTQTEVAWRSLGDTVRDELTAMEYDGKRLPLAIVGIAESRDRIYSIFHPSRIRDFLSEWLSKGNITVEGMEKLDEAVAIGWRYGSRRAIGDFSFPYQSVNFDISNRSTFGSDGDILRLLTIVSSYYDAAMRDWTSEDHMYAMNHPHFAREYHKKETKYRHEMLDVSERYAVASEKATELMSRSVKSNGTIIECADQMKQSMEAVNFHLNDTAERLKKIEAILFAGNDLVIKVDSDGRGS